MHFVIFGLTATSSWGNGHATLWRGLMKSLARRGHTVTFFERDERYYAAARDGWETPKGVSIRLYDSLEKIRQEASRELNQADVGMMTSYCPEADLASKLLLDSNSAVRAFYDLDTPVTLHGYKAGREVPYLPEGGLGDFDLVLSFTGGKALDDLRVLLHARQALPLHGWVDPDTHAPAEPREELRGILGYLGTFAKDRQGALVELFVQPAARLARDRFVLAGAQYPEDFPWGPNLYFVQHLEPALHSSFFSSTKATLNVTRAAMAEYGFCPSGRLFEAAACGACILSDSWDGIETFFQPGSEILLVRNCEEVIAALGKEDAELRRIGALARQRALEEHSADHRVRTLETYCQLAAGTSVQPLAAGVLGGDD
ncbi:glycosyltransferase [Acidobacteria bacterium AB60]|nr:glycosyltransferase [Acidobacteria bacterium AB60]